MDGLWNAIEEEKLARGEDEEGLQGRNGPSTRRLLERERENGSSSSRATRNGRLESYFLLRSRIKKWEGKEKNERGRRREKRGGSRSRKKGT